VAVPQIVPATQEPGSTVKRLCRPEQGVGSVVRWPVSTIAVSILPAPSVPRKRRPASYSEQLRSDLEELESAGIVVTKRLDYWLPDDGDGVPEKGADFDTPTRETKRVESYRFSLSPDLDQKIGKELWGNLAPKDREELVAFKAFFNSLSLSQLLIFTYEKYPEFTEASTIKKQLDLFCRGET